MKISKQIKQLAYENDVLIKFGDDSTRSKQGIHLAKPSERELEQAIVQANFDLFSVIYVYDVKQFSKLNTRG